MAKSKEVKQQEALARKRLQFSQKLAGAMSYRPGGKCYEENLARRGKAFAEQRNEEIQMLFGLYLREAQLDSHGNELVYGLKSVYSENDSVLQGFINQTTLRSLIPKQKPNDREAIHDFLTDVGDQAFN